MGVLGLDIGGANLKAATDAGRTWAEPFPVWKHPERLASRLTELLSRFPECDRLAVTMTAELADCFTTRAEGVAFLIDAVMSSSAGRPVQFWSMAGEWLTADAALRRPLAVAAANWHALATWAGKFASTGPALLIDVGSTTTDLVPLRDGRPPMSETSDWFRPGADLARLESGELVYTGVRRTPLCAVARQVPLRGRLVPLAAELFATTLDVYVWLGRLPEAPGDHDTANGRPATRDATRDRLARMVCSDRDELTDADLDGLATALAEAQSATIAQTLDRVLARLGGPPHTVVLSGSGEFLARALAAGHAATRAARVVSLADRCSPGVAEAACAYAVACLAQSAAE